MLNMSPYAKRLKCRNVEKLWQQRSAFKSLPPMSQTLGFSFQRFTHADAQFFKILHMINPVRYVKHLESEHVKD